MNKPKVKSKIFKSKADVGFYVATMAWPLLQFVVFYLVVNFNSILMAFQHIQSTQEGYLVSYTFDNFAIAFDMLFKADLVPAFKNSLVMYALNLVCGVGLGLLFSYFISKKMFGAGFFRVMLFLPSVLSVIVMTGAFSRFVDGAIPSLIEQLTGNRVQGLLTNHKTTVGTLMFYNVLVGFGTSVLLYSNAMSGISQEIYEAAKIDGVGAVREFVSISLPMIFGTVSTFVVAGIAGIFTHQMNVIAFYGTTIPDPSWHTLGSYIFAESAIGRADGTIYPRLSAIGLCLTVIAVPLTLGVKKLLEKFGPSED